MSECVARFVAGLRDIDLLVFPLPRKPVRLWLVVSASFIVTSFVVVA